MALCRSRTFWRMSARGGLVLATVFPAGKSTGSGLVPDVLVRILCAGPWWLSGAGRLAEGFCLHRCLSLGGGGCFA